MIREQIPGEINLDQGVDSLDKKESKEQQMQEFKECLALLDYTEAETAANEFLKQSDKFSKMAGREAEGSLQLEEFNQQAFAALERLKKKLGEFSKKVGKKALILGLAAGVFPGAAEAATLPSNDMNAADEVHYSAGVDNKENERVLHVGDRLRIEEVDNAEELAEKLNQTEEGKVFSEEKQQINSVNAGVEEMRKIVESIKQDSAERGKEKESADGNQLAEQLVKDERLRNIFEQINAAGDEGEKNAEEALRTLLTLAGMAPDMAEDVIQIMKANQQKSEQDTSWKFDFDDPENAGDMSNLPGSPGFPEDKQDRGSRKASGAGFTFKRNF